MLFPARGLAQQTTDGWSLSMTSCHTIWISPRTVRALRADRAQYSGRFWDLGDEYALPPTTRYLSDATKRLRDGTAERDPAFADLPIAVCCPIIRQGTSTSSRARWSSKCRHSRPLAIRLWSCRSSAMWGRGYLTWCRCLGSGVGGGDTASASAESRCRLCADRSIPCPGPVIGPCNTILHHDPEGTDPGCFVVMVWSARSGHPGRSTHDFDERARFHRCAALPHPGASSWPSEAHPA